MNLTTLKISFRNFPKQSKNDSPSSHPIKKYSVNQHPFMKTNYTYCLIKKLKYNPANTEIHTKCNHKINIIWFNPPFCRNVTTKIGKYFLNLLDKHFPQNHLLHKIFNRNSVKVSYSFTISMKTIITNHNKNILGKKPSINQIAIVEVRKLAL